MGTMCSQCSGLKTLTVHLLVCVLLAFWAVGTPPRAAAVAVQQLGQGNPHSPTALSSLSAAYDLDSEFYLDFNNGELVQNHHEMIVECF